MNVFWKNLLNKYWKFVKKFKTVFKDQVNLDIEQRLCQTIISIEVY